ncbi:MAG: hypothetical protein R3C03_02925 [Pirellulaceae bacterium]
MRNSPDEEIYLAVSHDFYDADDQLQLETIYADYEKRYRQWIDNLTVFLGQPKHSANWQSNDYPDWAIGEHVTWWEHEGTTLWLRIHHEDRECPILIAIAIHNDAA